MKTPWPETDDRRLCVDRRQFSYDKHIPERRSGKERRRNFDGRLESSRSEQL